MEIGITIENSAAVYIPVDYFKALPEDTRYQKGYWAKELTKPREHWLSLLEKLHDRFEGEFNKYSGDIIA